VATSVPNTDTFGLSDVVAVVGGNNLITAFANSVDNFFDVAYKGSKNGLLCFRNYITLTTMGDAYGITNSTASHSCVWNGLGYTMTRGGIVCKTSSGATTSSYSLIADVPGVIGQRYITGSVTWGGLTANTTYYSRCFVITSQGTSYSNEVVFTTLP
jgi:hypothetical protein